jgi:hypothetical protein
MWHSIHLPVPNLCAGVRKIERWDAGKYIAVNSGVPDDMWHSIHLPVPNLCAGVGKIER